MACIGERSGRGIVTDGITTPVVNTSAYFFDNTAQLIDFKVCKCSLPFRSAAFPLRGISNIYECMYVCVLYIHLTMLLSS